MYRVAKAENSSLKMFNTQSVLVEVKLQVQALMPKGADAKRRWIGICC